MSINPNMELWLHELETTRKPQARGALHVDGRGFCCLGIACEVAIANGVDLPRRDEWSTATPPTDYMPADVSDWLGITSVQQWRCVNMNDDELLSFPEIAARLRKGLA